MASHILERLTAIRRLMASVQETSSHEMASHAQRDVLVSAIRRHKVDSDEQSEIAEQIMGVAWSGDDHEAPLKALFAEKEPLTAPSARPRAQDYTATDAYYEQEHWEVMGSDAPTAAKLNVILRQPIKLGLRICSEETSQKLTGLLIAVTEGIDAGLAMNDAQRNGTLRYVKKEFKKAIGRAQPCVTQLVALPPSPSELLRKEPELYVAVYGESMPVSCPLAVTALDDLTRQVPMRLHAPKSAACTTLNLGMPQIPNGGTGGVQGWMQSMQQMNQLTLAFMQHMADPGRPMRLPPSGVVPPLGFEEAFRRQPTNDGSVPIQFNFPGAVVPPPPSGEQGNAFTFRRPQTFAEDEGHRSPRASEEAPKREEAPNVKKEPERVTEPPATPAPKAEKDVDTPGTKGKGARPSVEARVADIMRLMEKKTEDAEPTTAPKRKKARVAPEAKGAPKRKREPAAPTAKAKKAAGKKKDGSSGKAKRAKADGKPKATTKKCKKGWVVKTYPRYGEREGLTYSLWVAPGGTVYRTRKEAVSKGFVA